MLKNKKMVTGYYLLLVGFVAFQAIGTVFQGSQIVSHGKTVAQLEREKLELASQSYQLKQTLATQNSLLHISSSPVYNQFQPMAGLLKITPHQTVALR